MAQQRRWNRKAWIAGSAAAAAGVALIAAPVAMASDSNARPDFQMPFTCGETWEGNTREDHSPELAVDFRGPEVEGVDVISSAPGTVVNIEDRGEESYGKVVFIEHEDDWFTTYAHLNEWTVEVGDTVDFGSKIGTVGDTGNSEGAHLHYEQRTGDYLGNVEEIHLDGEKIHYYGNADYTSNNAC